MGGYSTVWSGTAFDCLGFGDEILLIHSRFESGTATKTCNNGMIVGHNLNRTFNGLTDSILFTSEVIIQLPLLNDTNNTLEGETVKCARDGVYVIGTHTITYTRHFNGTCT